MMVGSGWHIVRYNQNKTNEDTAVISSTSHQMPQGHNHFDPWVLLCLHLVANSCNFFWCHQGNHHCLTVLPSAPLIDDNHYNEVDSDENEVLHDEIVVGGWYMLH